MSQKEKNPLTILKDEEEGAVGNSALNTHLGDEESSKGQNLNENLPTQLGKLEVRENGSDEDVSDLDEGCDFLTFNDRFDALIETVQDLVNVVKRGPYLPLPPPINPSLNPLSMPPTSNPSGPSPTTTSPNPNPHPPPPPPPNPPPSTPAEKSFLKPRDISKLELSQLEGMEGEVRLTNFIREIEQCVSESTDRIKLAQTRAGHEIARSIDNEREKGNLDAWAELKVFLRNQFAPTYTVNQAFRELDLDRYDLSLEPRNFCNRLKYKHLTLQQKFPKDIKDQDSFVKERLHAALPPRVKTAMQPFKSKFTSLDRYLEHLEVERRVELELQAKDEHRVLEVKSKTVPVGPRPSPESSPSDLDAKFEQINQKLEALTTQMSNQRRPPYSKYCNYCRSRDHTSRTCPRNPPLGSCFDCLRMNCRRGQEGCPGRGTQTVA